MTNKWNEKYAKDLVDRSPGSLRSMNRGVSHLVAPLTYSTNNPSIKKICETQNKFLHQRNEDYIRYHDPMYGQEIEKSSEFQDATPTPAKKKNPSLTKTLRLKKLYEANQKSGTSPPLVHNKNIKPPDEKFLRKLGGVKTKKTQEAEGDSPS